MYWVSVDVDDELEFDEGETFLYYDAINDTMGVAKVSENDEGEQTTEMLSIDPILDSVITHVMRITKPTIDEL